MPKQAESIKVVFRVRPLNSKEKQQGRKIATIAHENQGVIELRNSSPGGDGEVSKTFTFDAVFSEKSTQRHIYDVCAAPVVQSVLEGYNGTVFAYGKNARSNSNSLIWSYIPWWPFSSSSRYILPHLGQTERGKATQWKVKMNHLP